MKKMLNCNLIRNSKLNKIDLSLNHTKECRFLERILFEFIYEELMTFSDEKGRDIIQNQKEIDEGRKGFLKGLVVGSAALGLITLTFNKFFITK